MFYIENNLTAEDGGYDSIEEEGKEIMETHSSCKSINMQMYTTLRNPPSMNNIVKQDNQKINVVKEEPRNL